MNDGNPESESLEEQVAKLREHVPDDKSDGDIRRVIEECMGDKVSFEISYNWISHIEPQQVEFITHLFHRMRFKQKLLSGGKQETLATMKNIQIRHR
jgi:hypothetical protein